MQQFEKIQTGDPVVAIQLIGGEDGMIFAGGQVNYRKWGDLQTFKKNDWLVLNGQEIYTVAADTFDRTYTKVGHGHYRKTAKIWAEQATEAGAIETKEGLSHYEAGDWLAYNEADRKDGYRIKAEDFPKLYRVCEGG